jgi:hypothetical protein
MGTEISTSYPLVITKHNLDQLTNLNTRRSIHIVHKCERDRQGKRRNFLPCVVNKMGYLALQKKRVFYRHVCVKMVYQLHCCISVHSTNFLLEKFKEFNLIFFLWRFGPTEFTASSFMRFLDHTQRDTTVGRVPLDE